MLEVGSLFTPPRSIINTDTKRILIEKTPLYLIHHFSSLTVLDTQLPHIWDSSRGRGSGKIIFKQTDKHKIFLDDAKIPAEHQKHGA